MTYKRDRLDHNTDRYLLQILEKEAHPPSSTSTRSFNPISPSFLPVHSMGLDILQLAYHSRPINLTWQDRPGRIGPRFLEFKKNHMQVPSSRGFILRPSTNRVSKDASVAKSTLKKGIRGSRGIFCRTVSICVYGWLV